jgi:DNA-binding GntR family transcriptional regulator
MRPEAADVLARLRRSILRGDWPRGTRAPSLADLVSLHGLNRSQATLVLGALAEEGLIVRARGIGPTVMYDPEHPRQEAPEP